ncbi:MAG TPA: thioredoxin family protein [Flavobacteriales bacterium]|nr:thioredoxin family protein [Flavobacteriales bacterium]
MSTVATQAATPEELLAAARDTMTAEAFRTLFDRVVAEGRTTGPDQSAEMVDYTKLNLARTVRNEKTVKLLPELQEMLAGLPEMHWLVITEAWCGDSSQVTPVLALMAAAAPKVKFGILLRDEHVELMDKYLTLGGRSIPKLIAFDGDGNELFTWGPRPQAAQDIVWDNKKLPADQQLPKEELYAKVHAWYAKDRGVSIQQEFLGLLKGVK